MAKSYWIRQTPETQTQVAVQFGTDRVTSIVKSCLLDYIASFLDSNGKNRGFVSSAFPSMSIYLSDEQKENISKDPTKREIQLKSLYGRVKEKLPCILLDDNSIVLKPAGLGKCNSVTLLDNKTQFWFRCIRDVTVSCIIGANTQTECASIRDALSVLFGELCKFINSNILLNTQDDSSSWTVTLNSQPPELGNPERIPASTGESTNNFVAFSTGTITCRFEGGFAVEMPATSHTIEQTSFTYTLEAPESVEVGKVGIVEIKNARPFGMRLTSSNANIASLVRISPTKFRLLARRKGTIKIQLIDECLSTKRQQWSSFAPQIVQEKTVQVI